MKPQGVTICVGYDDLLGMSLARNLPLMQEQWVVTAPEDTRTQALLQSRFPSVKVVVTDAFTRHGGKFNKGLAMEEAFAAMRRGNRHGWIAIWDADIVMRPTLFSDRYQFDARMLYGCHRLILNDPRVYQQDPAKAWRAAQPTTDKDIPGYFQLFNTAAGVLAGQPFWYDPTFGHAGGCDAFFHSLWSPRLKRKLPERVLHLGPRDKNWFGRVTQRTDGEVTAADGSAEALSALRRFQGWNEPAKPQADDAQVLDRIHVPGIKSRFVWGRSLPPE